MFSGFLVKVLLSFLVILSGCATKVLEYEGKEEALSNEEYEEKLVVKKYEEEPGGSSQATTGSSNTKGPKAGGENSTANSPKGTGSVAGTSGSGGNATKGKDQALKSESRKDLQGQNKTSSVANSKQPNKDKAKMVEQNKGKGAVETKGQAAKESLSKKRLPELEDDAGFLGRRPLVDPFRPGEKVKFSLTYFNVTAGYMTVEVGDFVEVNGEKSYNFKVDIQSSSLFSNFYSVDDQAVTYVDFDTLLPYNLQVHVKESKQLKQIRSIFDWKKLKANYWEKKITEDKGEQEKHVKWKIEPYSQNVISAAYYLRTFQLSPGKELAFRVADDGKNLVFTGKVLRSEKLKTKVGTFDTVVIKPVITVGGVFKPVGDILIWLTNDERKFIVRIESKIKIGTIIAKLQSIEKGRTP